MNWRLFVVGGPLWPRDGRWLGFGVDRGRDVEAELVEVRKHDAQLIVFTILRIVGSLCLTFDSCPNCSSSYWVFDVLTVMSCAVHVVFCVRTARLRDVASNQLYAYGIHALFIFGPIVVGNSRLARNMTVLEHVFNGVMYNLGLACLMARHFRQISIIGLSLTAIGTALVIILRGMQDAHWSPTFLGAYDSIAHVCGCFGFAFIWLSRLTLKRQFRTYRVSELPTFDSVVSRTSTPTHVWSAQLTLGKTMNEPHQAFESVDGSEDVGASNELGIDGFVLNFELVEQASGKTDLEPHQVIKLPQDLGPNDEVDGDKVTPTLEAARMASCRARLRPQLSQEFDSNREVDANGAAPRPGKSDVASCTASQEPHELIQPPPAVDVSVGDGANLAKPRPEAAEVVSSAAKQEPHQLIQLPSALDVNAESDGILAAKRIEGANVARGAVSQELNQSVQLAHVVGANDEGDHDNAMRRAEQAVVALCPTKWQDIQSEHFGGRHAAARRLGLLPPKIPPKSLPRSQSRRQEETENQNDEMRASRGAAADEVSSWHEQVRHETFLQFHAREEAALIARLGDEAAGPTTIQETDLLRYSDSDSD